MKLRTRTEVALSGLPDCDSDTAVNSANLDGRIQTHQERHFRNDFFDLVHLAKSVNAGLCVQVPPLLLCND